MSAKLVQNIVSVLIVFGFALMIGCSATKSGQRPTNVFSWPKVSQKQEERATATSMEEVLKQERVRAHP